MAETIGADDAQRLRIPQHQMLVMRVVGIEIAPRAGALADPAEGQFAQAADLAHHRTIERALEQPRLLAVAEVGQLFGAHQFRRHLLGRFRQREWCLPPKIRPRCRPSR